MIRPFQFSQHLILVTARKRFPFLVLSTAGVRGYFETRAAAESFISEDCQ